MNTTNKWIFTAVMAAGLIADRAPLYAQSVESAKSADDGSDTITVDGEDKPWSQGVPIATRRAARDLFEKGNELFRVPLFARAAEQYTAALSQWKHPAFYFNLALAQINLGQEVEAHASLEHALKYGEEPLGAKQFQQAKDQLQDVEHRLGRIRISCATEGAEVTLDGVSLFTGPGKYEGWAKAKGHEVAARRPDYLSEARHMEVSPRELKTLELRLITLSEAKEAGRRWATWKPWAVVAAGGVVAIASGVVHVRAGRNFSAYDDHFRDQPCAVITEQVAPGCLKSDVSSLNVELNRAMLEQHVSVGGYIVGGALVATGVALLYLNRPRLVEQQPMSVPVLDVTVVPMASANMLGIFVKVNH